MPRCTDISLQTLNGRLGPAPVRGSKTGDSSRHHRFYLIWVCNEIEQLACFAETAADDLPIPRDLTPREQELFDTAPFPEDDWTLRPCPQHAGLFGDCRELPE